MAQPQASRTAPSQPTGDTQTGATAPSTSGMAEAGNSGRGTVQVTNLGSLVAEVVRSATADLLSSVDDRIQAALANQGTGTQAQAPTGMAAAGASRPPNIEGIGGELYKEVASGVPHKVPSRAVGRSWPTRAEPTGRM